MAEQFDDLGLTGDDVAEFERDLPDGWEFRSQLNQAAVERFERMMDDEKMPPRNSFAAKGRLNAVWTRAAMKAELFNETPLKVDDLSGPDVNPSELAQVAIYVAGWYYDATRPPEKKS
jgi:hypothetical protein